MIKSIKVSNSSSAMYEREDAFANLLKPMLKTLNACEVEEEQQKPSHVEPPKRVRYIQLTAEQYAERRREMAEKERQKKVKKTKPPVIKVSSPNTTWQEWEKYCLKRFVEFMTPEEAAQSLQRPVEGVRSKSYSMNLKWKYTSEQAKQRILKKERSQRTEAQIMAHLNSPQCH